MKNLLALFLASFALVLSSCNKDDENTMIVDPNQPAGTFTAMRSGAFTAQNGTPTAGTVSVGTDDDGTYFLELGSDFKTALGTGTVTVFLSTSDTYMADPPNGNPDLKLVGIVDSNGESFYKLDGAVAAKFTHVIIWCASAGIPFGYAPLQ
ncbi:MAG: DM13 domain-containing protein [Lewinellaceae bacterium]|nr:DM13 domain-containing protein [Lewinellaceae bacterium]